MKTNEISEPALHPHHSASIVGPPRKSAATLLLFLILYTLCLAIAARSTAAEQGTAQDNVQTQQDPVGGSPGPEIARPANRADSVRALLAHLNLGEGSAVADIGAGGGQDTWVFAEIVGTSGKVLAQEVTEGKVKKLQEEAKKKNLDQVRGVVGKHDDPCLPEASLDLVYLRYVYHHFSKPREMLRGIYRGLNPGGYLVIVDKRRGTLQDWVSRDLRSKKHFWLAETTVVREAREEGFTFVSCPDEYWHTKDPFILAFQRPQASLPADRDPDPLLPLPDTAASVLLPLKRPYDRPVFIALGEGRKLMEPILSHSSGQGLDIVLEEWATQKEERPPLPAGTSLPSKLTEKGDPRFEAEPIDTVFFLDSYHLLFHGKTLLAKIHERLRPNGFIYVLDREAKTPLPRREASHRRRIAPQTVKQEMAAAGFSLWFEGPQPAADRFILVFGKTKPAEIRLEDDPFVGGPELHGSPEQWLKENSWRLRGLRTASGKIVPIGKRSLESAVESVPSTSPVRQTWKIPSEKLLLTFETKGDGYQLVECDTADERP